jgi:hypothetical protein
VSDGGCQTTARSAYQDIQRRTFLFAVRAG